MQIDGLRAFKQHLKERPVFGPFAKTCDPGVIETIGLAGFDFVILDMEHGPNSVETVQQLIRAAECVGLIPIVRVRPGDTDLIGQVLDVGAAGVQVPRVSTAGEAEDAVRAARFAPLGERGVCRYVRAAGYASVEKHRYFSEANEAVVIMQLEGQAALDNLDAILDVSGMDVVFVGPHDLSQSLGVPGDIEHPLVLETAGRIVDACLKRGVVVGTFTETTAQAAAWAKRGLRYLSHSVDMGILYESSRQLVSALRASATS